MSEAPEWRPAVKRGDKSTKNFKETFIIERPLLVKSYLKLTHVVAKLGGFAYGNLQWYLLGKWQPEDVEHCLE